MEKDIKRFRGYLKGVYKGIIDDDFMNYVIDNDIMFVLDTDHQSYHPEEFKLYSKNKLTTRILYNDKIYDYNKHILLDMFNILEQQIESNPKPFFRKAKREINKELAYLFDQEEKINALKNNHKKYIGKLDVPEDFFWYCKYKDNPTYDDDKNWFEQGSCYKAAMIENISDEDYNYLNYLVFDKYQNLKISELPKSRWLIYHQTYHIINFINDELEKLGYVVKKNKPEENSSSKFNSNQKTILIDLMFSQIDGVKWESMNASQKAKLISTLIDSNETNIRTRYLPQLESKNKKQSLKETINEMELFLNSLCSN